MGNRPAPYDYNRIADWLLPLLEERGMSIHNLAKRAHIWPASLYFYLKDQRRPTEGAMASICRVLGVPLEEGLRQYTPKPVGRPRS